MASRVQIARGNITAFRDALKQGELFFQIRNLTDEYSRSPHDEGILYIGDPKATGSSETVPIASARSVRATVFRGDLGTTSSSQDFNIKQAKFKYARPGDFWIWQSHAKDQVKIAGEEVDYAFMRDDFRKYDILFIADCDVDEKTGIASNIDYRRIGIKDARDVYYYIYDEFGNIDTDLDVDNVNDAIKKLERLKLQYKGVIDDNWQLEQLRTDNGVTRGSVWLVGKDDLTWPNADAMLNQENARSLKRLPKRGDFVYYENERCTFKDLDTYPAWKIIPCSDSDAQDEDYLQYERQIIELREKMEKVATFHSEHILQALESSDVRKALDFLMVNKAQLDQSGKVPLSQLHATVLGALQYKGLWNPISDVLGVTDPKYQNMTPEGRDEYGNPNPGNKPSNGDYWQVNIDPRFTEGGIPTNIQFQDPYDPTRVLELNQGDFIIWQRSDDQDNDKEGNGRWEVLDNSDRLSSIDFTINGEVVGKDMLYKGVDGREPPYDVSLVGNPHLKADYKLCLHQVNNQIIICGVRLVDQEIKDGKAVDGEPMFLPKYSDQSRNTLTNTDIKNYWNDHHLQYLFQIASEEPKLIESAKSYQPSNNTTNDNVSLGFNPKPNTPLSETSEGIVGSGELYIPVSVGSKVTIFATSSSEIEEQPGEIKLTSETEIKQEEDGILYFISEHNGYEHLEFTDLKISEIKVDDYLEKRTEFGSNVYIGEYQSSHTLTTYGDINLSAYLKNIGAGAANPMLNFFIRSDSDEHPVDFTKVSVHANDHLTESDIDLTLPEKTSTIIAKLPNVVFAKNHILKSTVDGYAESAGTLQELTDDEGNQYIYNNTHINTPNIKTEYIDLGYFEGDKFIKQITVQGPEDHSVHIEKKLIIDRGGHIFTYEQYKKLIASNGTPGYIPVFEEQEDEETGEKIVGLSDSKIKQVRASIYQTLKNNMRLPDNGIYYDNNGVPQEGDLSKNYLKDRYGDEEDATVIENDVIIGEIETAADGTYKIKKGKSLHVSNSLAIGNDEGASMHLTPDHNEFGYDIPGILEGEEWTNPGPDIVVERPLKSGIMLTHNSPISGGLWL